MFRHFRPSAVRVGSGQCGHQGGHQASGIKNQTSGIRASGIVSCVAFDLMCALCILLLANLWRKRQEQPTADPNLGKSCIQYYRHSTVYLWYRSGRYSE